MVSNETSLSVLGEFLVSIWKERGSTFPEYIHALAENTPLAGYTSKEIAQGLIFELSKDENGYQYIHGAQTRKIAMFLVQLKPPHRIVIRLFVNQPQIIRLAGMYDDA